MAINNHEFYMQTAYNLSKQSHCVSKQVGAVLVSDGRIISMGYNGSHPGNINCNDNFNSDNFNFDEHHKWSVIYEVHAEMNCLSFAAKNGIRVNGCDLYVTLSPCQDCLKNLIQAGIKRIFYLVQYHRNAIPIELQKYMDDNNIEVCKFIPQHMFLNEHDTIVEYERHAHVFSEHIKNSLKYHTSFIPDKDLNLRREYVQRYIHLKHSIKDVPRCPYTNEPQHFYDTQYIGISSRALLIHRRLNSVKYAKWISLEFLKDVDFDTIESLMKISGAKNIFHIFRQLFPFDYLDHEKMICALVDNNYHHMLAKTKVLEITNGKTLLKFISWLIWTRLHNTDPDFYIRRGWTKEESDAMKLEFYRSGMEAINIKRANDPEYDTQFRDSRLIGLKSNKNKSKLQNNIVSQLRNSGLVIEEDVRVRLDSTMFPNKRFLIDFKHKNCLVEVNGSYWHHDVLTHYTSLNDYVREIIKAREIILKTGCSYFIIWEHDIKNGYSIDDMRNKLISIDDITSTFYSTRVFDEMLFDEPNLEKLIINKIKSNEQ